MLKEIRLVSFKGFHDFTVPLEPFTNFAGLNSGGKTTVLQAIKFVFDLVRVVFGNEIRPSFGEHINWESNPERVIQQFSFNDPDAIWLNRNTTNPCRITVKLDGDIEIDAQVFGRNRYTIDIRKGSVAFRPNPLGDKEKKVIIDILALKAIFVPPIGGTSPSEKFLTQPQMKEELQKGRFAETFRNSLYWLYNDGQKEQFDQVVSLVQQYIPESRLLPPRLSHDNPPQALLEFDDNGQRYDIALSGAGLRTLVNLASVLIQSGSSLLLIDEPDAHLHSSLQRAVARMLIDFVAEAGVQIITATHAPDFIAEVPVDSLLWIDRADREARRISDLGKALADLLKSSVIAAKLRDGKSTADVVEHLPKVLKELLCRDVKVVALCDNDYELPEPEDEHSVAVTLPRKEVENFLVDPTLFADAAKSAAKAREGHSAEPAPYPTENDVAIQLNALIESKKAYIRSQVIWKYRERLPSSLAEPTKEQQADDWFNQQWSVESWRLAMVPGKKVLSELRGWCSQKYHLTVTINALLSSLNQVPSELKVVLERVVGKLRA